MWPNERVVRLVTENFLPVRLHVRQHANDFQLFGAKYGAHWTPTILFLDSEGVERHRMEGFLPLDDFLAQITLGLGHLAFSAGNWQEAERQFQSVTAQFPASEAAPEGQYWAGVSRYKATGNAAALAETAVAFDRQYQDTSWAKKASVWKGAH